MSDMTEKKTPNTSAEEASSPATADAPEENEVVRETRLARDLKAKAEKAAKSVNWKTAAGIGIGSAALIAAALYAGRKKD
jgi:hypothetical protein